MKTVYESLLKDIPFIIIYAWRDETNLVIKSKKQGIQQYRRIRGSRFLRVEFLEFWAKACENQGFMF